MSVFVSGMTTMGFLIAALFFFRFWRRTKDNLFVYFGASFVILAITQFMVALLSAPTEHQSLIYALRLLAFVVLIVGIVTKNMARTRDRSGAAGR